MIVGTSLASVLSVGYGLLSEWLKGAGLLPVYLILLGVFALFFLIALVRYVIDCGSAVERLKFLGTFGLSLALMPVALILMVGYVRHEADRTISSNNLKQIGISMLGYHDANERFPADIEDKTGKKLLSWRVQILPYIEENALYAALRLDEPWDSEHNKKLLPRMPKVYAEPGVDSDDNRAGRTRLQGFAGPGTPFEPHRRSTFSQFAKGTSSTILVAVARESVPWTKPADLDYRPDGPLPALGDKEGKPPLVLLADGSVKSLPARTREDTLRKWIRLAGDPPPDRD